MNATILPGDNWVITAKRTGFVEEFHCLAIEVPAYLEEPVRALIIGTRGVPSWVDVTGTQYTIRWEGQG